MQANKGGGQIAEVAAATNVVEGNVTTTRNITSAGSLRTEECLMLSCDSP